tara:strand:+ start:784 stop:1083 length:300 start_codon:yes stop_codon:yes gene_type:complete
MPQGGFSRDFQTATNLRHRAEQELRQKERDLIGDEVIGKLNPYFEREIAKIEEGLILKQDETIEEFITMMKSRNILLKYLLWTNIITLTVLSFTLGYFL